MQANKAQLKAKMTWLGVYLLRSAKFDVPFIKGVFSPSLVRTKKKIIGRQGNSLPHKNGKKILGVPPMGSEPCLSEPKLGNVATALQGDSLTLRANLTVPICT